MFLCQHQIDSVSLGEYAVKKVPIGDDREWLQNMLREVHILERIRHPNIIDYKHTWIEYYRPTRFGPTIPTLFVLMEYANGGNLEDFVLSEIVETSDSPASGKRAKKTQPKPAAYLEEIEILTIFASIAKGLEHLHGLGIIHRDLKPANLLLHYDRDKVSDPTVLISDFGQSTEKTDSSRNAKRTGVTGTIEFMAPELLLTDPETSEFLHEHTQHSDIWSLGMVAYFMYFGHLPYSNVDDFDVLHNEILGLQSVKIPTTLRPISSLIARLLSDMLNVDPTERPLAKKIINVVAFVIGSIRSSPKLRQPPSQLPGHSLEGFPLLRLVGTSNKSIKPAKLILGYFLRRASTTSKTLTIINVHCNFVPLLSFYYLLM